MFLTLGSCRVLVTMNHSRFECLNTFRQPGKRHLNPKKIIGRSWSINEQYELLLLILSKKPITKYKGCEFTYDEIKENIEYIRSMFDKIEGVIIEPSSIKYYTDKNENLIHNIEHHKEEIMSNVKKHILTEEEIDLYLNKIINLLQNKKIIFVNHFLHTKIPNRMLINKCLKKITNKNVKIVTPSNLWDNNSKWDFLKDEKHYKNLKVIKRVANYIDLHI